ncbi:matrix-remodeling-associated protein 7-like [Plakobranchus ocellatus]|uniref:Matrix-remodeling-associated protein 7-like n=1 Tax=Plakobranchus ocellatus TaxID=259542 RepID=A0AAV3YC67_9GAST|nr:matrix-remodeling-associated protein 7-like [Plakobranchus ocellatus]
MDIKKLIAGFLEEPLTGVCVVAFLATVAALIVSTKYLRNLLPRSRSICRTSEIETITEEDATSAKKSSPSAGNVTDNGDDELEGNEDKETSESTPVLSPRYPDPVDYCEHIQGEIKRVQQKVATKSIAESLTEEQLMEEREIQRRQLADIFRLMQEQQDRFGIGTMDDMQEQMKLYAV